MNALPNKKIKVGQKQPGFNSISPKEERKAAVPEAAPVKTEHSEDRDDQRPDQYHNKKGDLWFVRESQRAHEAKEKMKTAIGRRRRSS